MQISIIVIVIIVLAISSAKVINQYQKGIVFTLGKFSRRGEPWLNFIIPIFERCVIVDVRERAVDVPSQEAMTKDNISLTINAVLYYKVDDAEKAVINVQNLDYAIMQFAMTTMRNIVGQFELDELLSKKESANQKIMEIVEQKSEDRWVNILSVELKDINIPDSLKRTISKQAEAEREKRSKIIDAEGELLASEKLSQAAEMLSKTPWALHLRTLQSINDISSDDSNTTVRMVPIEVLKALEGINKKLNS